MSRQIDMEILKKMPLAFAAYSFPSGDFHLEECNSLYLRFTSLCENYQLTEWDYFSSQLGDSWDWDKVLTDVMQKGESKQIWLNGYRDIPPCLMRIFSPDDHILCLFLDSEESPEILEHRMLSLIEHGDFSIWSWDFSNDTFYISSRCLNRLGYDTDASCLSMVDFLNYIHSLDRERVRKILVEFSEGKRKKSSLEIRLLPNDGGIIWVNAELQLQKRDKGQGSSVLLLLQDITSVRQTEDLLQASEENFHAFFDSMDDMIFICGPSGSIVLANQSASDRLGLTLDELRRQKLLDLVPKEEQSEVSGKFQKLFSGSLRYCSLNLESVKTGIIRSELRIWFGIWDKKDCLFAMARDTTAQWETQQRFEVLFQNNPALMIHTTLPDWKLIHINDSFLDNLEYTRQEVIGHTLPELNILRDKLLEENIGDRLERDGHIHSMEIDLERKDGSTFSGLFSGEVIQTGGQDSFLAVVVDISDRKMAEQALIRERDLFSEGPVLILLMDGDKNYSLRFVSGNVLTILGYASGQMIQENFSFLSIIHPDDRNRFEENIRESNLKGSDSLDLFFRIRSRKGVYKWFYSLIRMERDSQGNLTALHGYIFDQTELKDTQSTLSRERQRLRDNLEETARMNRLMMGRESRVVEMKKEVNLLLKRLGEQPRYKSVLNQEEM